MPDNYDKLWLQRNLNQIATSRALEEIQKTGRALPCKVTAVNGALVTVEFEVTGPQTLPPLTLPKAESQWLRAPVQIGDVGITQPADTYLGGISGQGSGVADTSVDYGNMSTLVWIPVATTSFQVTPDPNKAWVNGPNGAALSDSAQTVGVTCDHTLQLVTIYAGGNTIVISADPAIVSTVIGSLGNLQTIMDGAGNAISHVVPAGGLIGLGAVASSLSATRAAAVKADLQTLANNVVAQTLQTLSTAIGAAAVSASIPNSPAFSAILSAAGFVTGLSGINPTIPGCSSVVRVIV